MKYNINIPKSVQYILDTLESNGYESYIVGGCVRDSILGRVPHDYDICTSATPDEIISSFPNNEIIPTGLQHGTVTIVIDKEPYEVTTYRIDGNYSDNRRPDSVQFTNNLVEDLKRRDFTINAMAYNPKIGFVDPFGGINDIKNEKIRCVGSAKDRFNEDALRILRAIRFASQLDFVMTPDTMYEVDKLCDSLKNISVERINSEFCKIVSSKNLCIQMILFDKVFSIFIPEIKDMFDFQQNNPWHIYDVWNHTIHAIKGYEERYEETDLIIKLALFFHDIGKPHSYQDGEDGIRHFKGHARISAEVTDEIMRRLKFDNDTRNKVVELVYYHDSTINVGKKYVKRWLNKIGEEQFKRLLKVKIADNLGQNMKLSGERIKEIEGIMSVIQEVIEENECFSLKDLAINGNDLINIGYKTGKKLGNVLSNILEQVIDGDLENNKEDLLNKAKEWLR